MTFARKTVSFRCPPARIARKSSVKKRARDVADKNKKNNNSINMLIFS